jgi:hypothetical protein
MAVERDTTDRETIVQARIMLHQWIARFRVRIFPHEREQLAQMIHARFKFRPNITGQK